jgi:crotonobetainyl-CoA:carnitine CoA-transferase CaiB-like acyl-CoA transferase
MLPLEGIKVVDFTAAMAGPQCTLLLADFGADVVKIEPPGGDHARRWGKNRFGERGDFSGMYIAMNRNKASFEVDLKSPEGMKAVNALLREADVVVENFRPGVADRLGIGYESVRAVNQKVVYCSISGFGQSGPLKDRAGLDMLLQAYAGHMSVTGEAGRPSIRNGPAPIDVLSGTNGALGIMMALYVRKTTGRGQYVETSLYESAIEIMSHFLADYTGSGEPTGKSGSHFAFASPYGMFQASDREFYMGVSSDRKFLALCQAIGREDLARDPRFSSNAQRIVNRGALNEQLFPVFAARPAAHWVAMCIGANIPVSLVETVPEVVHQDQLKARNMLLRSEIGDSCYAGLPIRLSETPGSVRRQPPTLGQDNEAILKRVGGQ